MLVDSTAGRGPDGTGRRHQAPGRDAAAGEWTGSGFFRGGQDRRDWARRLAEHINPPARGPEKAAPRGRTGAGMHPTWPVRRAPAPLGRTARIRRHGRLSRGPSGRRWHRGRGDPPAGLAGAWRCARAAGCASRATTCPGAWHAGRSGPPPNTPGCTPRFPPSGRCRWPARTIRTTCDAGRGAAKLRALPRFSAERARPAMFPFGRAGHAPPAAIPWRRGELHERSAHTSAPRDGIRWRIRSRTACSIIVHAEHLWELRAHPARNGGTGKEDERCQSVRHYGTNGGTNVVKLARWSSVDEQHHTFFRTIDAYVKNGYCWPAPPARPTGSCDFRD